jgi:hypothetical protein
MHLCTPQNFLITIWCPEEPITFFAYLIFHHNVHLELIRCFLFLLSSLCSWGHIVCTRCMRCTNVLSYSLPVGSWVADPDQCMHMVLHLRPELYQNQPAVHLLSSSSIKVCINCFIQAEKILQYIIWTGCPIWDQFSPSSSSHTLGNKINVQYISENQDFLLLKLEWNDYATSHNIRLHM